MNEHLITGAFIVSLIAASVKMATPYLFMSLGETFSEKAGIFNIGLEGYTLMGAFTGFIIAYFTGNPWIGLLGGILGGLLVALIAALLMITVASDQIVTGLAINVAILGFTSAVYRLIFGINSSRPVAPALPVVSIPGLSKIPVIGKILFEQLPVVYLGLILVPVCWVLLYKMEWGLNVRAVGEYPEAAKAAGVNVKLMRYLCVGLAGMTSGLAGSFLSVGVFNSFFDNMVAGRGFIAIAVVIFGKWNPIGVLLAALFFSLADTFQLGIQSVGINLPYQFVLMFPYILTIIAISGLVGHVRAPAALGVPLEND